MGFRLVCGTTGSISISLYVYVGTVCVKVEFNKQVYMRNVQCGCPTEVMGGRGGGGGGEPRAPLLWSSSDHSWCVCVCLVFAGHHPVPGAEERWLDSHQQEHVVRRDRIHTQ